MEDKLQKLLAKITWLNVGDDRLQAEFSAHLGWSGFITLLGYWLWGTKGLAYTGVGWICYSIYKECLEDGHIPNMLRGIEPWSEIKDFYTDLLARLLPAVLILVVHYLAKKH